MGGPSGSPQQPGVTGYQDLLWSAAALAACLYGLVLPVRTSHLAVAFVALAAAGLAKQEGLVVGGFLSLLIATRLYAHGWAVFGPSHRSGGGRAAPRAALLAILPMLPGLTWAFAVSEEGVGGSALQGRGAPGESLTTRVGVTIAHLPHQLPLVPVAIMVAVAGILVLRWRRTAMEVGHPAWLWAAGVACLMVMIATYGFGKPEIHWWLSTSINRTTTFDELLCLADMVVWTAILLHKPSSAGSKRSGDPGVLAAALGPG